MEDGKDEAMDNSISRSDIRKIREAHKTSGTTESDAAERFGYNRALDDVVAYLVAKRKAADDKAKADEKAKADRRAKAIEGLEPLAGDIYDDLTERAEHCCGESKFDVVVGTNVSSFGFGDNDRKEKEIFETKTPEETVRKFYELIAKYKADGTLGDCVIAVEDDNEYDQVTILAEYDGKETKSVSEVCWC
jgi:hypothetical protein